MDPGALDDIGRFLRSTPPFDLLPEAEFGRALRALRIAYHPRGRQVEPCEGLCIVRSGAVELRDGDNRLLGRLGEGDSFQLDARDPLAGGERQRPVARDAGGNGGNDGLLGEVIEDALIYRLPPEHFAALRAHHRAFDRHFSSQRDRRLRRAARYQPQVPVYLAPVTAVMSRDLLTTSPETTVRDAAAAMAARRMSSILVVDSGQLVGIVTDRDLRARVLAADLPSHTDVCRIMTPAPTAVDRHATLFDATLAMTRCGVHHLPVLDGARLVGMITTSDLITARQNDPVYLVQRISRAGTQAELAALAPEAGQLLRQALTGGMQPQPISKLLTAVSDAILRRLVALAEAELGPAPAPWTWLAFGSQARAEQLLGADQDNGIVIDDTASDADLAWYAALATRVCDGLAACGYAYCPGDVMATADDCRLRLADWRHRVRRWAQTPTPAALMRVSIFFDLRAVHGEVALARDLQQAMLARATRDTIFLAALAASALDNRPPLGIFRRFVVERDGEHRDRLDIKKRGVLPITEIVRLHALAHGIEAVNTDERLRELARGGHLPMASARNLADALHCVQRVRMRHQAEQVDAGRPVDNFVDPRALPRLARGELRDAFAIIDEAQTGVRQRYRAGLA